MIQVQAGDLLYYQFSTFAGKPISRAVFSRRGGVSPAPWDSLNFGFRVGDSLEHVESNHQVAIALLGRPGASRFDVHQVHGNHYVIAKSGYPPEQGLECDIVITADPRVTLIMRYADSVPILLYDPRQHVAGIVHAGWRGTINNAVGKAVEAMKVHFSCQPADILAALGPCICQEHYQVGPEVTHAVDEAFGRTAPFFRRDGDQHGHLDLLGANRHLLEEAGIRRVESSGMCTACDLGMWYSHRAEKGATGRFAVMIGLEEGSHND